MTAAKARRPSRKPGKSGGAKRGAKMKPGATRSAKMKPGAKRSANMKPGVKRGAKMKRHAAERPVVLLSGGNPQIAKADGNAPVQAYIAALPGWKRDVTQRVDALVDRSVPHVYKAVKWNSPLYGIEGQGFFLGVHMYTRYIKLAFFRGSSLRPQPPGTSKHPQTRYLDIYEADELDESQLASWFEQAASLPGWQPGKPT